MKTKLIFYFANLEEKESVLLCICFMVAVFKKRLPNLISHIHSYSLSSGRETYTFAQMLSDELFLFPVNFANTFAVFYLTVELNIYAVFRSHRHN